MLYLSANRASIRKQTPKSTKPSSTAFSNPYGYSKPKACARREMASIYEIAADNYGLVTASQAVGAGVTRAELRRYASDGRLERRGHALYRLVRWVPTEYDRFAEAVALVGDGAVLYGEAVLAMLGLASANPAALDVATPKRVRRSLPGWVRVVQADDVGRKRVYMGVPCQHVADAILSCRGSVMGERLVQAAKAAREQGWIGADEERRLRRELSR